VSQPVELIARSYQEWGRVPHVVGDVFADTSPAGVASALDAFCRRELGSAVQSWEFFDVSVGSVQGLRLRDGRRVVVKVQGPRAAVAFLRAVRTVQQRLFEDGFPAPQPLLGHRARRPAPEHDGGRGRPAVAGAA
jgi:hypothetical protein